MENIFNKKVNISNIIVITGITLMTFSINTYYLMGMKEESPKAHSKLSIQCTVNKQPTDIKGVLANGKEELTSEINTVKEEKRMAAYLESYAEDKVKEQSIIKTLSSGTQIASGKQLTHKASDYASLVNYYCDLYDFPYPDVVEAIILTESSGNVNAFNGYAAGYMQIECTLEKSFKDFGKTYFNETWTLNDRFIGWKNIAFGVHRLKELYIHYDGDLEKVIQGYNFSHFSLDLLIDEFGDDWLSHRGEIAYYNGVYKRTGRVRYGNPVYLEKVLEKLNK